jgi:NADH-quinone oxidoreductase subunit L
MVPNYVDKKINFLGIESNIITLICLLLFIGWEGVGLCSYFLIGFWFKKDSANAAAIKAFIVNRVGDFGFALGIFLIFYFFDTVNYSEVFSMVPNYVDKKINFLGIESNIITLICLLLFIGWEGVGLCSYFLIGFLV